MFVGLLCFLQKDATRGWVGEGRGGGGLVRGGDLVRNGHYYINRKGNCTTQRSCGYKNSVVRDFHVLLRK